MAYTKPRRAYNNKRKTTFRAKKTIYKRKSSAAKTAIVAKKALALAKYNNKLAYGNYQLNFQTSRRGFKVTNQTPVCFHMVTPRNGEGIYQFLPDPQAPGTPLTFSSQTIDTFQTPSLEAVSGGPGTGGNAIFDLWKDTNDDNINGKYKLLTTHLKFTVSGLATQTQRIRYRIDFVRPKNSRQLRNLASGNNINGLQANLPGSLGSFNSLLTGGNQFNPLYWRQVAKPIFFNVDVGNTRFATPSTSAQATTFTVQKECKIKHYEVLNPVDIGTAIEDEQAFRAVSEYKQMWAIISSDCDYSNSPNDTPVVNVSRIVSWRDKVGHAA